MMKSEKLNLSQKFPKRKCDGNVCVNKTEVIGIIILERCLFIELCGECQRLSSLSRQIRVLTDTTELKQFSNPFIKWGDISQFEFNGVIILKLLKQVLKRSNEIRDLISITWYGFEALETGIENIIANIHLVENFEKK